jgi:hypothetical protein
MLINCDAGALHPKVLATRKLSSQPQFEEWMRQSMAQLEKTGDSEELAALQGDPEAMADKQNEVINLLIFQRLMTVFSAILDAAALSNNWILVNRAAAAGSSPAGEYLLEVAMQLTSQKPVVIVIDSMLRISR